MEGRKSPVTYQVKVVVVIIEILIKTTTEVKEVIESMYVCMYGHHI